MKQNLRITTAIAAALLLPSCGPSFDQNNGWKAAENTAVCTDRQGRRVDDSKCSRGGSGGGSNAFLWYYLMAGRQVPATGEPVHGGSFARPSGVSFTPASKSAATIARGGFGSSARFAAVGE